MARHRRKTEGAEEILQRMTASTVEWGWSSSVPRPIAKDVLLALNRLAGAGDGRAAAAEVEGLVGSLSQLLGGSAKHKPYMTEMMEALNQYAEARGLWKPARPAVTPAQQAATSARRLPDFEPRYEIRRRDDADYLVEIRAGSDGNDFQVTHRDYDAAVTALTHTGENGLRFTDLRRAYFKAGGHGPDYRLRVILRFLRLQRPPLITRTSARYVRLLTPDAFQRTATAAWQAASAK